MQKESKKVEKQLQTTFFKNMSLKIRVRVDGTYSSCQRVGESNVLKLNLETTMMDSLMKMYVKHVFDKCLKLVQDRIANK